MAASSHLHLLHHLFRPAPSFPPPSATSFLAPLSILLIKPLSVTTTSSTSISGQPNPQRKLCPSCSPTSSYSFHRAIFTSSFLHPSASTLHALSETLSENNPEIREGETVSEEDGGDVGDEAGIEDEELEQVESEIEAKVVSLPERDVPDLTVKERKELSSYAHSLGDKLRSQQVGKSGITENVVMALGETLEKREFLKLKIHKSCPGEMGDVVNLLERTTGSAAISQIGRTVIFYRPSLKKMEVEEKMRKSRKVFMQRRERTSNPGFTGRGQERERSERPSGRGRRGGGRVTELS